MKTSTCSFPCGLHVVHITWVNIVWHGYFFPCRTTYAPIRVTPKFHGELRAIRHKEFADFWTSFFLLCLKSCSKHVKAFMTYSHGGVFLNCWMGDYFRDDGSTASTISNTMCHLSSSLARCTMKKDHRSPYLHCHLIYTDSTVFFLASSVSEASPVFSRLRKALTVSTDQETLELVRTTLKKLQKLQNMGGLKLHLFTPLSSFLNAGILKTRCYIPTSLSCNRSHSRLIYP